MKLFFYLGFGCIVGCHVLVGADSKGLCDNNTNLDLAYLVESGMITQARKYTTSSEKSRGQAMKEILAWLKEDEKETSDSLKRVRSNSSSPVGFPDIGKKIALDETLIKRDYSTVTMQEDLTAPDKVLDFLRMNQGWSSYPLEFLSQSLVICKKKITKNGQRVNRYTCYVCSQKLESTEMDLFRKISEVLFHTVSTHTYDVSVQQFLRECLVKKDFFYSCGNRIYQADDNTLVVEIHDKDNFKCRKCSFYEKTIGFPSLLRHLKTLHECKDIYISHLNACVENCAFMIEHS